MVVPRELPGAQLRMHLRWATRVVSRRRPRPITRRPVGTKDPKRRVVVVAEGEKTEPQYLALLRPRCVAALIELEVVDEPATDPRSLVRRAVDTKADANRAFRRTKDPNDLVDEVWCVFDVDEHPFLHEATQHARDNHVQVAISNPSFELWLLLHFVSQTAFLTRDEARRRLRQHLVGYDKTLPSLDLLEGRFADARARANALDRKHEGDGTRFPDNNPSSGVSRLIDAIEGGY